MVVLREEEKGREREEGREGGRTAVDAAAAADVVPVAASSLTALGRVASASSRRQSFRSFSEKLRTGMNQWRFALNDQYFARSRTLRY